MPANAAEFFKVLTAIAAFDILEIGEYVEEILDLMTKEPVNEKFEAIGFESTYFINNLGSFIFLPIGYVLLILLWITLYPCKNKSFRLDRCRHKLAGLVSWNRWIVLITESFLVVTICFMIAYKYDFEFAPWGQRAQTFTCIIFSIIYIAIPLYALAMTMIDYKNLHYKHRK